MMLKFAVGVFCSISIVGGAVAIAAEAPSGPPKAMKTSGNAVLPEIVVYKNHDLNPDEGVWTINTGYSFLGSGWNDTISSFIVVRGNWQVCRGANFDDCRTVNQGKSYDMHDWDGWDDTISSLRPAP